MKKVVALFALLLLTAIVWAQNPKLSYQAVVRDNSNKLVTNDLVQVDIGVLKADNTPQYSQHFANVQTNQNGLFSLLFGGETGWDDVSWINARIGVRITLPDGSSVTDTTDVTAVPLAINTMFSHEVDPSSIAQSDWTQTDTDDPSYIKNKPNIPAIIATYIDTSAYFDQSVANNITNYLDTASAVPSTEDLEALANRVDLFNTNVCDSVAECLSNNINLQESITNFLDSSSVYNQDFTDKVQNYIDSSAEYHSSLTEDIYNYIDTSIAYQNNLTEDIHNYIDSSAYFDQSVANNITNYIDSSAYFDQSVANNITNYIDSSAYFDQSVANNITNYIDSSAYFDQSVVNNITNYLDTASAVPSTEDLEALANRVDLFNTNVCDSVRGCVNALISDTAKTLRSMIRTASGDVGSLALRVDLFNTNVCDSVAECLSNNINLQEAVNNFLDSSSVYNQNFTDKVQNYIDSSAEYHSSLTEDIYNYIDTSIAYQNNLTEDIHNYIDSSAYFDQSVANNITNYIDSSAYFDQSVVNNITNYLDTASAVPSTEDLEALANRVDLFNTNVCDSVAECLSNNINLQESITNFLDSSSVYNQDFTDKVQNYIDSSAEYHSSLTEDFYNYIDTSIAYQNNLTEDIHNYIDSSAYFDQSVANNITNYIDSSAYFDQSVVNNITNYLDTTSAVPSTEDLEALANRVDLFNTNVCDSVAECLSNNINLQESITNFLDSSSVFNTTLNNFLDTTSHLPTRHTHSNKDILDATTASYTTAEQTKLAGIEEGAEKNVNADWDATEGDAEILNKPTTIAGYGITDAKILKTDKKVILGTDTLDVSEAAKDGKLFVKLNGDTIGTFSANQATDAVINVTLQQKQKRFVATEGQTTFSLGSVAIDINFTVQLIINNQMLGTDKDGDDAVFTVSGSTITYLPAKNGNSPLHAGDKVQVIYFTKGNN